MRAVTNPQVTQIKVDPCEPPLYSLTELINCAKAELKPGRLAFAPKEEMEQGKGERIFIRISPEAASDLSKGFKKDPRKISAIKVGPVMRAILVVQPDEFVVQRVGDEQKVLDKPYTDGSWYVTPLESGEKENVLVYAELMLPDGKRSPWRCLPAPRRSTCTSDRVTWRGSSCGRTGSGSRVVQ